MRKAVNVLVECPFFISCSDRYIICEGIIDGTRDKHFFKTVVEKNKYEKNVCSQNCGKSCLHYKRVNELYEKGLRWIRNSECEMKGKLRFCTTHHCHWQWSPLLFAEAKKRDRLRKHLLFLLYYLLSIL